MMRTSIIAMLLVAAAGGTALGQTGQTFTSAAGHYRVTTDVDRATAQQIVQHMERIYAEYDRRLSSFHTRDSRAMPLYVFSKQKDYLRFLNTRGIDAANSGGMFFSDGNEFGLATWVQGQGRTRMFQVLQHEGFHQFAAVRLGPDLPVWANEGLAEYFGEAVLAKGKFVTGLVSAERLRNVQEAVRAEKHNRFEKFMNMPAGDWGSQVRSGQGVGLLYDQAWSMVHFLVNGENGRYAGAFEKYLEWISKGELSRGAFEKAFQTRDYGPFEQAWKRYVLKLEPDPVSTAVRRLQFLAAGLRELRKQDVAVRTMDELKEKLQARKFKAVAYAHGRTTTMTAEDDENFEAPPSGDARKPSRTTLIPSKDARLLPELRIEGLRLEVVLTWKLGEDGDLVEDVSLR